MRNDIGIAAIRSWFPTGSDGYEVPNSRWDGLVNENSKPIMGKRFAKHSGVLSRRIATIPEYKMGSKSFGMLLRDIPLDPKLCKKIIVVSSSSIPKETKHWGKLFFWRNAQFVAWRMARKNGFTCPVEGINWGCPGYCKSWELLLEETRKGDFSPENYWLIITSSRLSTIIDHEDSITGPLFGDVATITLVTPMNHPLYPPILKVGYAHAEIAEIERQLFWLERKRQVLRIQRKGVKRDWRTRICLRMNGDGVAERAPKVMAEMAEKTWALLGKEGLPDLVFPHPASDFVVGCVTHNTEHFKEVPFVSGGNRYCGNVSGSSFPVAMCDPEIWKTVTQNRNGDPLRIVCPAIGIGWADKKQVSQGCFCMETVPNAPNGFARIGSNR